MSTAATPPDDLTLIPDTRIDAATIERALIGGDLKPLSAAQRMALVVRICESLGLNPWTTPFAYIELQGKLVLYAKRDCTDQLRRIHAVSVVDVRDDRIDDLYKVTTRVSLPTGRTDVATGVVAIGGLKGVDLANQLMKAETKSKRRATLSICGLGVLDESEVDDARGDVVDQAPPPVVRRSAKVVDVSPPFVDATPAEPEITTTLQTPPPTNPDPPRPVPHNANGGAVEALTITDTAFIKPKDADPYYEVRTQVAKKGAAPIAYIFVTRDKAMYDLAASAEGSPQTFRVLWKRGKRPDGSDCKILEELAAD